MNLSIAKLEHAVARRITHAPAVEIGFTAVSIILTILVAFAAFAAHLNLASAASILLLLTVIASIHGGVVQGTAVSVIAAGCLDFLFTTPLFKFSVHSRENWVALSTFEVTALLVSRLSWKERLHVQEEEYQRKAIGKLYQLSNAILLVDERSSDMEQLGALVREFFAVRRVDLWVVRDVGQGSNVAVSNVAEGNQGSGSAFEVFAGGLDADSVEEGWSKRVLRMGTSPLGGMVLQGWEVDPALADAAASLIAVAIERTRSAQKKNRAEAARNTEQLRTAVLDALAHSFKTPLTAIQTASSGLLAIGKLGESQNELVEIIDEEVGRLANLTTRLLQTAALDAREIRVRFSKIHLLPLVESVVGDQPDDNKQRIRIVRPESLEGIQGDAQLLRLALEQLIDNALKYSTVGTEIELRVDQDEAHTSITISNDGEPIRAEELGRIFERYYRGAQAGKGPTGTGLGLSIVRKIAEAHGGDTTASCQTNRISMSISLPQGKKSIHG